MNVPVRALGTAFLLLCLFTLDKGGLMATEKRELQITSTAFKHNATIPRKYTCEGVDVSPPLSIGNAPDAVKSYAIIVDDPDAPMGTFVHWVAWNIDPTAISLNEGESIPAEGRNDFRQDRYRGPCPPPGSPHRYFFKVFALDTQLDISKGSTRDELVAAMDGHILSYGELVGIYQR
ncbi:MAG: putative lipoprotein LppC [Chlamydiae bacterium]|nr:putative lipoprotein LppC [Chlamydiota bacterium]